MTTVAGPCLIISSRSCHRCCLLPGCYFFSLSNPDGSRGDFHQAFDKKSCFGLFNYQPVLAVVFVFLEVITKALQERLDLSVIFFDDAVLTIGDGLASQILRTTVELLALPTVKYE